MPLVVIGLVTDASRSLCSEIEAATPEELERAIAARDMVIADLTRRVMALEEEALMADLLHRASALEDLVAATVTEPSLAVPTQRGTTPAAVVAALAAREANFDGTWEIPDPLAGAMGRRVPGIPVGGGTMEPIPGIKPRPRPVGGLTGALGDAVAAPVATPASEREFEPEHRIGAPLPEAAYAAITGGAKADPAERTAVAAEPEVGPSEEADLDHALRALERTLVQEGGLLLPEGAFEVASAISYTHDTSKGLRLVDGFGAMDRNVRRDTVENSVTFRLGLPWSSQAEVRVPQVASWEEVSTAGFEARRNSGFGLGDIEIGLTRQLLRESDLVPDLLGSVRWKTATGESSFETKADELAVGSGFHAISGHLTAVKSREPMVFYGTLSYTGNLPDEKAGVDINPGDTVGISFGSILAAGPGTSLRSGLGLNFSRETEVNGRDIPGSDGVSAMLELGASAVLPFTESRSLLSVTAGIGVTDDAPDLQLEVSLPYRF